MAASDIALRVNGAGHRLTLDTRVSVLDLLREQFGLTGSKKGCDHGQCGACTVLLDGRRANACLALAVAHDGADVVTIEGLEQSGELHAVQRAFVEQDGFQRRRGEPARAGGPGARRVRGGGARQYG